MGRRVALLISWVGLCVAAAPATGPSAPASDGATQAAPEGPVYGPLPASGIPPTAAPTVSARDIIVSVELQLPKGVEAAGLSDLVAVRAGQVLSTKSIRRSIERLFSTGRFSDVVVRAEQIPHGIRVIFELSVPKRIVSLVFTGQQVLSEDAIRKVVRLSVGEAYFPERLDEAEEAVAAAYRGKGYDRARAKAEVQDEGQGSAVKFRISEGEPTRVAGITLAGTPGLPISRVLTALGMRPGDVLDRNALTEGLERVKALYHSEHFYQLRLGELSFETGEATAWIQVPVAAGPRFSLRFAGQRSYSEDLLSQVMNYQGEETLDRGLLNSLARKVEVFYRFRGFHDARVRPREIVSPNGDSAALVFEVEEGRQLALNDIIFDGNTQRSDSELKEWVRQRVEAGKPPVPVSTRIRKDPTGLHGRAPGDADVLELPTEPERIFVEDAFKEAAGAITERYREEGFQRANVQLQELDVDVESSTGAVRFKVEEGPLTRVGMIEVTKMPPEYVPPPLIGLKPGTPLHQSVVEANRLEIVRTLGRAGWLFSQVKVETTANDEGTRADLRFRIEAGPRVRVGQVVVQGLGETKEALVRAHVLFKPGQVLDPELLFETQRRLTALGLFRQVVVRFLAPDEVEAVKDVVVEVRERPRLSGEVSGGYSLSDGPRVAVDATYPNLFGEGLTLAARGQINYVGASTQVTTRFFAPEQLQGFEGLAGRANISLEQLRIYQFLPTEVSARVDVIAERVLRPSYRFTRFAAIAGLRWIATKWLSIGLNYEVERDQVQAAQGILQLLPSLQRGDTERLRFPVGVFNLQTIAPTFRLDFRDDRLNPTKGALITLDTEFTKDMGAEFQDGDGNRIGTAKIVTFKASANVTGYVPLGAGIVLAMSLRGGEIFRLDPESITIAPKRFFLGGATSMRGFREDGVLPADRRTALHGEVLACRALANPAGCTASALAVQAGQQLPSEGGELFTLGKVELRIPIWASFGIGIFGEVGNLWLSARNYKPFDLRYVTGVGIRYMTPVGPLALDLGINVTPDPLVNETNPQVQFTVGSF